MRVLGWIWVAVLSAEGLVLIFPAWFGPDISALVRPGRGTALQLIAASILFAAVLSAITREPSRLAAFAALSAAVLGWAGTWLILAGENRILAALVVFPPGVVLYLGAMLIAFAPVRSRRG